MRVRRKENRGDKNRIVKQRINLLLREEMVAQVTISHAERDEKGSEIES